MNAIQPDLKDDSAVRELHPSPGAIPAIVALSVDPGLVHAVEELSASVASLTTVMNVAELSERLLHGASGILLIDAAAVPTAIGEFVDGIARQFPELVLVVAGGLAEQGQLAAQIGTGRVYRFVHKPASAQRLRLFIEAAARHHASVLPSAPVPPLSPGQPQASVAPTVPGRLPPSRRLLMGAGGVAVAALIATMLFFALRGGTPEKPPVAATATSLQNEARAAQETARATSQAELDQLLSSAESALIEVRLDDAERLAVAAQVIAQRLATPGAPENTRVRFLQVQIAKERERVGDEEQRRAALDARQSRLASLLKLAGERMQKGLLIEPARDNALHYVESALQIAPGDAGTSAARSSLVKLLLAAAERSVLSKDVDAARRLTDAAAAIDASQNEVEKLRRRADELRTSTLGASEVTPPQPAGVAPAAAAVKPGAEVVPSVPAPAAAPARQEVVAVSALTRLRYVAPQYPTAAHMVGRTGWVDVEFTVAIDGSVKDVVVTNAEPRNVFENNTLAAMRRWRFAPVLRDGTPIEQRARLRVRFSGN